MSDDPLAIRPIVLPHKLYEHFCEHVGCKAWGGWGYARGKQTVWFCWEHHWEGEIPPNAKD
jgi:hypothetical protein